MGTGTGMELGFDDSGRLLWSDTQRVGEVRELVIWRLQKWINLAKGATGEKRERYLGCMFKISDVLDCFQDGRLHIKDRRVADTLLAMIEWYVDFLVRKYRAMPGNTGGVNPYAQPMLAAIRYYFGLHDLLCDRYERLPRQSS
ncbi:MAG: hypothetical protein H0Z39_01690 [Peptococcaceae bacterium]|nr:hypothetical protein [Peptococcaceae bacterium]